MKCIVIPTSNTSSKFAVLITGVDADILSKDVHTCSKLLEGAYKSNTDEGDAINRVADVAIMIMNEVDRVSDEDQEMIL